MFAYGRTILKVKDACDPRINNDTDVVRATAIVDALTSSRDYRMRAAEAVRHAFFKPAKMSVLERTAECILCCCEECEGARVNVNMGVTCARDEKHFICQGCLKALVTASLEPGSDSDSAILSRMSDGKIHCSHCLALRPRVLCEYTDSELAKSLPAEVFSSYLRARMQLVEDRRERELELHMQERLEQVRHELARLLQMRVYMYVYMHGHICIDIHTYIYTYIHA
jgi:hypothetical protein